MTKIESHEEHQECLALVSRLISYDPKPGTVLGNVLKSMAEAVYHYEREHFPLHHETQNSKEDDA